ncbi:MAG: sugar phosphate isomerase/epimerase [Clostridia bacterium]|nr:sugar phosphate isomerase/epimerase [Clostridia bacterium]
MKWVNYSQFHQDRIQYGLEYAAKHSAQLGFDAVEYIEVSYTEHIENVDTFKEILNRYGLRLSCYTLYVQLFTPDQDEVERHMLRHVETAAALGAKYLHHTLFPPYDMAKITHSYGEVFDGIVDVAERIAKACNKCGIVCLYEPQGAYFNGIDGLEKFLKEMRHRGCDVGVCGDFGNALFVDVDPREVFRTFAKEIRHVHIKDYLVTDIEQPDRKAHRSRNGHLIYGADVGTGSVDFAYGFRELKKAGYEGDISFEIKQDDDGFAKAIGFVKNTMQKAGFEL